jgi:hypothetical protein
VQLGGGLWVRSHVDAAARGVRLGRLATTASALKRHRAAAISWLKWLKEIRSATGDAGALRAWQELVDALVVAGNTTLAPYSD